MKKNSSSEKTGRVVKTFLRSSFHPGYFFVSILVALMISAFGNPRVYAADETADSPVLISRSLAPASDGMSRKELSGKIGAKNMNGIAVVYENDTVNKVSREMWMPFEEETYLDQYENLDSIQEGDQVRIIYDEDLAEGKRLLRGIALVRKAEVEIEEFEESTEVVS